MADINEVCDYIIMRLNEAGESPSILKLQKLLYYSQSWNLAINKKRLFEGMFQAWVHGPVNRAVYDRFIDDKSMYSSVSQTDAAYGFNNLAEQDKSHINNVLEVYAPYSGNQLEELTHQEEPWQEARKGYKPSERCEVLISEQLMQEYYSARLDS
jgi:uncharacterized phage-associated protein